MDNLGGRCISDRGSLLFGKLKNATYIPYQNKNSMSSENID